MFVDWPSFLPRHINPTLPRFALFAAWAWPATRRRPGAALAIVAASSALTGAVWFYMAGAYYFTNVGAALGMHAT